MWTPALPNPMPANVAAMAMDARASLFWPSRTASRNEPASRPSAFSDHMSAIGLDPQ